jgi:hypothetical protein
MPGLDLFAWQIRKVRHDHTGEWFVFEFVERGPRRAGPVWSNEGRELLETELRLRAIDRGISALVLDEVLQRERRRFHDGLQSKTATSET